MRNYPVESWEVTIENTLKIENVRSWARSVHSYAKNSEHIDQKTALAAARSLLHSGETAILCTSELEAHEIFPIVTQLLDTLNEPALYPDRLLSLRIAQVLRLYMELTAHKLRADEGSGATLGPLKGQLIEKIQRRLEQAEGNKDILLTSELLRFRESVKLVDSKDSIFPLKLAVRIVSGAVELHTDRNPGTLLGLLQEMREQMHATWYPFSFEVGMLGRIAREEPGVFDDLKNRIEEFTETRTKLKDNGKQYGLLAAVATLADCAEESQNPHLQLLAVEELGRLSHLKLKRTRCRNVRLAALEHLTLLTQHPNQKVVLKAASKLRCALPEDRKRVGTLGVLRPPIATPTKELNKLLKPDFVIKIESIHEHVESERKLVGTGGELEKYGKLLKRVDEKIDEYEGLARKRDNRLSKATLNIRNKVESVPSNWSKMDATLTSMKCEIKELYKRVEASESAAILRSKKPLALHLAARQGRLREVQHLLKHSFNIDTIDPRTGLTPLWEAVLSKQFSVVSLLIKEGAQITDGPEGMPLLTYAIFRNRSLLPLLIEARPDILMSSGAFGSPLHDAVASGDTGLIDMFVEAKVSLEAIGRKGWTPLALAIVVHEYDVARHLIELGASAEVEVCHGFSLVKWAVVKRNAKGLKALLTGPVQIPNRVNGVPVLARMITTGDEELVRMLLTRKLDCSYAMQMACNHDMLTLLAEAGHGLDECHGGMLTPLQYATIVGNTEAVIKLLELGANTEAPGEMGQPALWMAVIGGHFNIVRLLCEHEANPFLKFKGIDILTFAKNKSDEMCGFLKTYQHRYFHFKEKVRCTLL